MENQFDSFVLDDKYIILQDLFLKGDDIQKLSIIQALPQLVRIDQTATFSRIVPKIQQELPKASSEFQVTTSQIFRVLIEKELPINLLGAVIQGVDSRDPVVSAAWMDTLLAVIPLLTENIIKNEIMPLIVIKSQLNQPIIQRVAACRIIGKIANHKTLNPTDIKKDILPFVHSLSQDCSIEVRAVMCMQLPFVAEGIGINIVKTQLLPCFVELASDNNPLVREAAVLTMVNLFPYIEKDLIETTMIPLIKKFCGKCIPEDNTAAIIASQYGAILENIMLHLSNDDKNWFITYYRILCRTGFENRPGNIQNLDASKDVICRENCAVNLPAVAKFVSVVVPQQMDVLYTIFRDLAGDPCYIVRRAVAGCIHEIAKILGPQNRMLKAEFVRLLRDDAEDVLQMLVPNLSSTLILLAQFGFISKERTDQTTMEISRAVLKCQIELAKGYNWRLFALFMEQLECLPQCMPSDFIHQHFTPIILGNASNGRVKPVRYQAIKTLLVFLRNNKKDNQQKWLRDALINQFCYSDSCYTRQIYVKLCFYAMDIFSSKYFKEYFFQPLICLSEDPISNVRYSFISILSNLKLLTLLPPIDSKYKVFLQDAINKLENKEKEKYVINYLKTTLREVQTVSLIGNKDYQTRDLIKQEQEAAINNPVPEKQVATITAHQNLKSKTTPATMAITSNRPGRRPSLIKTSGIATSRGSSVSSTTPSTTSSIDMTFLEQHFYIDAGINLPNMLNTNDEGNVENDIVITATNTGNPIHTLDILNDSLSDTDIDVIENTTSNMTDDVKVNLRKANNQSISRAVSCSNIPLCNNSSKPMKNKRHSSAFLPCIDNKTKNPKKRHSLNISSKEFSKIPICIKKRDSIREILSENANLSKNRSNFLKTFPNMKLNEQVNSEMLNDISNKISTVSIESDVSESDQFDVSSVDIKSSSLPIAIRKPNK